MANFTIRVELHGADPVDYETLHALMATIGCVRELTGTDASGGIGVWMLPTAEYDYTDPTRNAFQVRDLVKVIADRARLGAWVLVTEVKDRAWNTKKIRSGPS